MNAEVKSGKLTELGVIPEEWNCCSIEQLVSDGILEKPMDGNHGNIHPKSSDFVSDGIPFVMANNIKDGSVDLRNCSFIRKSQADNLQKGFSKQGDVLLTHKATIGQVAIVGCIKTEYIMLTPQVTYYRVLNTSLLNNIFLRHFFESDVFQRVLQSMSGGGTRSYIGITAQRLLPVLLPPLAEQLTIAGCLSDFDTLINCLDQLIAKKSDIKQAAMQELLTGQQRLPGFSGEWEVKRLGDVLRVRHGKNQSAIVVSDGKFPVLATGGEIGRTNTFLYDKPSVLIGRKGTIDRPIYRDEPFWTVDTLFYTEITKEAVPVFIYYKFLMIDWRSYNEASGVPSLNASTIEAVDIVIPDIPEQTAIAAILSDMDSEIIALETRRDKAHQLKHGMMQELLTGRIRLL